MIIDIVLGCSFGHEGKGKVAYELCKKREYDLCVRFNGSEHADHTIHTLDGHKWTLHQLPTGILFPKTYNLICGDSVINIENLFEEIRAFKQHGINVSDRLFVSKSCILSENDKRVEDVMDIFAEMGIQVVDMQYFWKMYFRYSKNGNDCTVLIEGTRGFELDKNWTNHTELSSSVSCTLGGAINIGINIRDIRNIYGVSSMYNIYTGNTKILPDDEPFHVLEGIDTNKSDQKYSYLNLDRLCHALKVNNCNVCIINRTDIIKYIGIYGLILYDKLHMFDKFEEMELLIHKKIKQHVSPDIRIVFSYSEYVI